MGFFDMHDPKIKRIVGDMLDQKARDENPWMSQVIDILEHHARSIFWNLQYHNPTMSVGDIFGKMDEFAVLHWSEIPSQPLQQKVGIVEHYVLSRSRTEHSDSEHVTVMSGAWLEMYIRTEYANFCRLMLRYHIWKLINDVAAQLYRVDGDMRKLRAAREAPEKLIEPELITVPLGHRIAFWTKGTDTLGTDCIGLYDATLATWFYRP